MHKAIALFVALLISQLSFAQKLANETGLATFYENGQVRAETIVEFYDVSAVDLFIKTNKWVAKSFKNTNSVVQSQIENEFLRISGKSGSVLGPYFGNYMDISYTLAIDFKDGKVRVKVNELLQVAQSPPYTTTPIETLFGANGKLKPAKRYKVAKEKIDAELNRVLASLIAFISTEQSEDEW